MCIRITQEIRLVHQQNENGGGQMKALHDQRKQGGHKINKLFVVAISYKRGVILCEQYTGRMSEQYFADFVKEQFPAAFVAIINPKAKRVPQEGYPNQNSKLAKRAMERLGTHLFCIPTCSPDMKPIGNLFHQVGKKLQKDELVKNIYL